MSGQRKFLGDGVYASCDGWYIWLETERGTLQPDRIAIEPEVYAALRRFAQEVWTPEPGDPS